MHNCSKLFQRYVHHCYYYQSEILSRLITFRVFSFFNQQLSISRTSNIGLCFHCCDGLILTNTLNHALNLYLPFLEYKPDYPAAFISRWWPSYMIRRQGNPIDPHILYVCKLRYNSEQWARQSMNRTWQVQSLYGSNYYIPPPQNSLSALHKCVTKLIKMTMM